MVRVMHHEYVESYEQMQSLDSFRIHETSQSIDILCLETFSFRTKGLQLDFRLRDRQAVPKEVGPWEKAFRNRKSQ